MGVSALPSHWDTVRKQVTGSTVVPSRVWHGRGVGCHLRRSWGHVSPEARVGHRGDLVDQEIQFEPRDGQKGWGPRWGVEARGGYKARPLPPRLSACRVRGCVPWLRCAPGAGGCHWGAGRNVAVPPLRLLPPQITTPRRRTRASPPSRRPATTPRRGR